MIKRFLLVVSLLAAAPAVHAASRMAQFVSAPDGHTIIVRRDGVDERVPLVNVFLAAEDEPAAREFLERRLAGKWVYVEDGNVYRSPDALFINRELAYRAYTAPQLQMRVFGEVNPGPRDRQRVPLRVAPARTSPRRRIAPRRVHARRR